MKKRLTTVLIAAAVVSLVLSACRKNLLGGPLGGNENYATRITDNTEIMPENVIQLGESFDYYPGKATGHFECTVTGVRVVEEASQCPPYETVYSDYLCDYVDGKEVTYRYADWFTEEGAFVHGCRIVLVDLTVTNVDAKALTAQSGDYSDRGFFLDPYAFYAAQVVELVDLTNLQKVEDHYSYRGFSDLHFSRLGEFSEKDIPETLGTDQHAIKILPGETVAYTIGFGLNTNGDGSPVDLSMLMLCRDANTDPETGLFIEIGLGEDSK